MPDTHNAASIAELLSAALVLLRAFYQRSARQLLSTIARKSQVHAHPMQIKPSPSDKASNLTRPSPLSGSVTITILNAASATYSMHIDNLRETSLAARETRGFSLPARVST